LAIPLPGHPLFMVEVRVADWPRARRWYRDVLGLREALIDEPNQFALLDATSVHLALKAGDAPADRRAVRLVFHVPDLDAERSRLLALGVPVSDPIENPAEGYREIRLADPDGTPVSLFTFTKNSTRNRDNAGPEFR
jgi:catechol 2,3-dioxygenase-like lactoylglutathione lyase family enzyme